MEDWYTRQPSFVGDKLPEVGQTPSYAVRSALWPASPDPRADVRQILQRYRPLRAFGRRYELFRDDVVGVGGKAAFLPGKAAQAPPCSVRAFALELAGAVVDAGSGRA